MAHSFSQLKSNLAKLWARFTPYFFHFVYWFGFPCIILYGKYFKLSPLRSIGKTNARQLLRARFAPKPTLRGVVETHTFDADSLCLVISLLRLGLSLPGRNPMIEQMIDFCLGVEQKPDPNMMMMMGGPGMM